MALVKTHALVIRSRSYRETSLLFSALTPNQGTLHFLGKGFREKHRGFMAPFEPLTCLEIIFYERTRSHLQLLKEVDELDCFPLARESIYSYTHACYFLELVDQMTWGGHQEPAIFELLIRALRAIGHVDLGPLMRSFQIHFLALAGFSPQLHECVFCREKDLRNARFSYMQGGVVCRRCAAKGRQALTLSVGTLETMRYMMRVPFEKALKIRVDGRIGAELGGILRRFIAYRLEGELRTLRVLNQLGRLG